MKQAKSNQSLEKALQIIEYMADYRKPARLQDIAQALSFPASTVIRYLATLVACQYAKQDAETLRYSLTLKLSRIGSLVSAQYNIRDLVRRHLTDLVEKTGESACLAIEEHHRAVYIDVESGPDNALRVMQRIGKEAPLHCTGVGKLLLLNYDEDARDKMIAEVGLEAMTPNTITNRERLSQELNKIRADGYAIDDEECELGARCVAAPILDYTGTIVASLSVSGPVSRMTFQKINQVIDHVSKTALQISREMGYSNDMAPTHGD